MTNVLILYSGISLNSAPRVKYLYDELSRQGNSVSVGGVVKENDLAEEYNTDYVRTFSSSKSTVKKIISFVFSLMRVTFNIISSRNKFDVIYAINPGSGMISILVGLIGKVKIIYETQEIFLGTNHKIYQGNIKYFWYTLEKTIARKSHLFIATDEFRARFLRRYYRIPKNKVDYVLNVPSVCFFNRRELREQFGFNETDFIISYCGVVAENRAIEDILKSYSKVETDDTVLVLAGYYSQGYRLTLDTVIESLGIRSVIFTGNLSNHEIQEYMALSDCTFALYERNCLNNRINSPNKIFDAVNASVTLITTSTPLSRKLQQEYPIITLKDNSISEIETALRTVLADEGSRGGGYSKVHNKYTIEYQMPKFVSRIF